MDSACVKEKVNHVVVLTLCPLVQSVYARCVLATLYISYFQVAYRGYCMMISLGITFSILHFKCQN